VAKDPKGSVRSIILWILCAFNTDG